MIVLFMPHIFRADELGGEDDLEIVPKATRWAKPPATSPRSGFGSRDQLLPPSISCNEGTTSMTSLLGQSREFVPYMLLWSADILDEVSELLLILHRFSI
jgi:hypothetical protein